jgi:hypothetical protein
MEGRGRGLIGAFTRNQPGETEENHKNLRIASIPTS